MLLILGSLSSILAFACPLFYLVRLLNTSSLLKCALRSSIVLYLCYKSKMQSKKIGGTCRNVSRLEMMVPFQTAARVYSTTSSKTIPSQKLNRKGRWCPISRGLIIYRKPEGGKFPKSEKVRITSLCLWLTLNYQCLTFRYHRRQRIPPVGSVQQ